MANKFVVLTMVLLAPSIALADSDEDEDLQQAYCMGGNLGAAIGGAISGNYQAAINAVPPECRQSQSVPTYYQSPQYSQSLPSNDYGDQQRELQRLQYERRARDNLNSIRTDDEIGLSSGPDE